MNEQALIETDLRTCRDRMSLWICLAMKFEEHTLGYVYAAKRCREQADVYVWLRMKLESYN